MKNNEGILLVLSGPSGAGKGTICKRLQKEIPIEYSVSATTRAPRVGEVHGKDYFFLNKETFEKKIRENEFLEWARVYDNYYGTPIDYVQGVLAQGKDCILEIDPQGAKQVKKKKPDAVYVFILPPSMQEQERRLTQRGTEKMYEIEKRISSAQKEISAIEYYDYVVVNDEVIKAVEKVKAIIIAEKCKVQRHHCYL